MVAELHNNLGIAFYNLGQPKDELFHKKQALDKLVEIFSQDHPTHPDIAVAHNNVGTAFHNLRRHEEALPHYLSALKLRKKSLPHGNPDIALSCSDVAFTYYALGDQKMMAEFTLALIELLPVTYLNIMTIYSENIRTIRLRSMREHLSVLNSIIYTFLEKFDTKIFLKKMYNVLLRSKDISAEAEYIIRIFNLSEKSPEHKDNFKKLREKQQQLDHFMINNPMQKDKIKSLNKEIQDIEIDLSQWVSEIKFKHMMERITADAVLEKLSKEYALLEYGHFNYVKSTTDKSTNLKSGEMYYAYLLLGGNEGEITLRYLGSADSIHEKLNDVHRKFSHKVKGEDEKKYPHPLDAKEELSSLYQLLVDPFMEQLQKTEHLYIAPDGELYTLAFEQLLDKNGKELSDKFSVSYISTGRDIVHQKERSKSITDYTSIAILSDPQYDIFDGIELEAEDDTYLNEPRSIVMRQSRDTNEFLPAKRLPFGRIESESIAKAFNELTRKCFEPDEHYGVQAKKNTLSQIGSPNIIHISTHGFALKDQVLPNDEIPTNLEGKLTHSMVENPLIRSGLVFSGYNNWLKLDKKRPFKEYGDGILNAKEVLYLNLSDVDLMTLSACQTGLGGEAKNGEGIKGLRRAFELVGVNTLICTLWEIPDCASAILMENFYKNLLQKEADKRDKLKALTRAKEYVRDLTYFDLRNYLIDNGFTDEAKTFEKYSDSELKEKKPLPFAHPYFWSGYILQGSVN
jgi:CHAT domain-containing protein